jgi:uncharacterized membrane protein
MLKNDRNDAMINGALIGIGTLGVFDNMVNYWILELHRAVPGLYAWHVEAVLVVASAGLLLLGWWREMRARRC